MMQVNIGSLENNENFNWSLHKKLITFNACVFLLVDLYVERKIFILCVFKVFDKC